LAAELHVDAREFFALSQHFAKLPKVIKERVTTRALRRMQQRGTTEAVRQASRRIKLLQKLTRPAFSPSKVSSSEARIYVKSGWIPLSKLATGQGARGVKLSGRKQIRGSFLSTMGSGHGGVFKRTGASRLPIKELYGPNPANDIATSPDEYADLIADIMGKELGGRMLHELGRALASFQY